MRSEKVSKKLTDLRGTLSSCVAFKGVLNNSVARDGIAGVNIDTHEYSGEGKKKTPTHAIFSVLRTQKLCQHKYF